MLSFWNFCNGPIFFLPLLFGFTAVVIVIFLEPDLIVAGFWEFLSPRLGKDINLINLNELSWEGTLKWFKHTAWETCQILLQEDELRQKAWCYISALTWPGKVSALMVSQWNPLFTKGGKYQCLTYTSHILCFLDKPQWMFQYLSTVSSSSLQLTPSQPQYGSRDRTQSKQEMYRLQVDSGNWSTPLWDPT